MTREEAIETIKRNCTEGSQLREACAMFIPELKENEDEKIREELIALVVWAQTFSASAITKEEANAMKAYLEKRKDANKAIEAVDRIDKYIDTHTANAHDMDDSNPEKKYYQGWDDALGKMSGILQDVYSNEKQKAPKIDAHENDFTGKDKSGDEGMCKRAIAILKQQRDFWSYDGPTEKFPPATLRKDLVDAIDVALFYLERQKEQKPVDNVSREEYVKRFKVLCDAYEIKLPNREYDIYHLCDDLSKLSMDSGKHKSAEWSEEDEELAEELIKLAEYYTDTEDETEFKPHISWLKSLPERLNLQPKQEVPKDTETLTAKLVNLLKSYRIGEETATTLANRIADTYGVQRYLDGVCDVSKQEWSEEDEKMLKDTIRAIHLAYPYALDDENPRKKNIDWLKDLKERFNSLPKQEWGEEDERIIRFYEADYNNQIGNMSMKDVIDMRLKFKNWLVNRLKVLRPQPNTASIKDATKFGNLEYERGVKDGIQSEKSRQWKPSEEQMGALNYAYCELFKREDVGHNILGPLQNLIDTLKKL